MGKISALHRNDTVKQKRMSKEEGKHQGLDRKKIYIVYQILDSFLMLGLWYPSAVWVLGSGIIFQLGQCLTSLAVPLQDVKQHGHIQSEYISKQSIPAVFVS